MGDKLKNYGIVDKLNIKIIHNIINPALSNYFNEMLDKNMFLDYYNRLVSFGMENEVISLDTSDIFDKTGIYAIDITNLNVDEGNNIYFDIISIHATYQLIDFICSYEIEDKNLFFLDLSDDTILLNFWSDVIVGYAYEFFIDKFKKFCGMKFGKTIVLCILKSFCNVLAISLLQTNVGKFIVANKLGISRPLIE